MKKIFSLFLILVSTLNIGAYAAPNVNDKKSSNALLNQKKLQKNIMILVMAWVGKLAVV